MVRYYFCSNGCCGNGDWVRIRNGEIDDSGGDVYDGQEKILIIDHCCVCNFMPLDDPRITEISQRWAQKYEKHLIPIPPLPDGFYQYNWTHREWFRTRDWDDPSKELDPGLP